MNGLTVAPGLGIFDRTEGRGLQAAEQAAGRSAGLSAPGTCYVGWAPPRDAGRRLMECPEKTQGQPGSSCIWGERESERGGKKDMAFAAVFMQ